MTVLDLITDIMLQLGCINQGDTPNASEATQIFNALNQRLDLWNADSLHIYGVTELALSLLATQQSYGVGASGPALVLSRPLIRHARVQLPNSSVALPLEVIGQAEWNAIEEPTLTGQRPQRLFPDYNWPTMTVKVHPIPSINCTAILDIWSKISQFLTVTDTVDLPYGYLFSLKFKVCVDVYPSFASQVPPTNLQIIMQNGQMADQQIMQLNAQLITGRAPGPVPEMMPGPVSQMPNAQASPTPQ